MPTPISETDVGEPPLRADGRSTGSPTLRRRSRLLEPEVVLLVLLVTALYFCRLGSLSIRGEETRRATIAREMIETGDWNVPRQQGEPYLSRPPMQNWAIALVGMAAGEIDELAVRLPSALAVLLTTLLVYSYARLFLNRLGGISAAAAFATFGQILELGRLGETDALLTLCVSGSLLLWHRGWMRGWPRVSCWVAGYGLAGLGALVKGPQAPIYFAAPVFVHLCLTGQWRHLRSSPHFAGLAVFGAVVGSWLIPFFFEMGLDGVVRILSGEVAIRFGDLRLTTFLGHLASFPIQILIGGLLPWSPLLIAYLDPNFRRSLGAARPYVRFLTTVTAVTFPTCWLVPGAETRLCVSIFPIVAPLIGLVVQRCHESIPPGLWEKLWRPFAAVLTVIMAGIALAILATAWMDPSRSALIQPPAFAVGCTLAAAAGGVLMWWSLRVRTVRRGQAGVVTIACFAGLVYSGAVTNSRINDTEGVAAAVAQLKEQLPAGARLISFGGVHHLFRYHYRDPIDLHPWPTGPGDGYPNVVYFCFDAEPDRGRLPLEWERLSEICCDRSRHDEPRNLVIIGRRLPGADERAGGRSREPTLCGQHALKVAARGRRGSADRGSESAAARDARGPYSPSMPPRGLVRPI